MDLGYGIEDTVHGELLVERCEKRDRKDVGYRMKVIRAEIKKNYRPGKYTVVME